MHTLLPHLGLARTALVSNVWLLRDREGRRFLIDTGYPLERRALLRHLARAGVRGRGDLTAILLTHGHSDHAGNAAFLRERFAVDVYCHEREADALCGLAPPPRLGGRGALLPHEVLCRIEDRWPARTPIDGVFGQGPFRWGFHALEVGGHTPGSVLLWHEPTATLLTGDSLLTGIPPVRAIERLRLAVPEYSIDVRAAHTSTLARVADLPRVAAIAPGHGPLVTRDVATKLRALARRSA